MTPITFPDDEPPTRDALDRATDWRRLLTVFHGLGSVERESLITHIATWARLPLPDRVEVEVYAKLLDAALRAKETTGP